MDFVTIRHPDITGTASCTADAFHLIYQAKGWQLADAPVDAPQSPAEPPAPEPPAAAAEAAQPAPNTQEP